jgi:hypothetical protein
VGIRVSGHQRRACALEKVAGCRGDDLWGLPRAELFAGWRPRSLHGSKTRRPAPPGGPAAPGAGWRFHRGRPEPDDEDENPPNGRFAKSELTPTRATEAKDRRDERHDQVQPISDQEPFPTIGSKAEGRQYASQMPVPGERYFIKRSCQSRAKGSR